MRILRNILMMFFGVLLVVNITRYFFVDTGDNFTYRGLSWVFSQIGTFNGLSNTIDTIQKIGELASAFNTTDLSVLGAIINGFKMLYYMLSIPVRIVVDIVENIVWVFKFVWL